MASMRLVAMIGAAALAGAGIAAVVLLNKAPVAAPAPAPVSAAPAAAPAAAAPPAPAPADDSAVHFANFVQQFSLVRDSAAYVGASFDAPQLYPLKAGTGLTSASRSPDGAWVVALTADGQAAFLPAADLGPYNPHTEPQLNLAAKIGGTATVVDTATLQVNGTTIALGGVVGETGEYADKMQELINAHGGTVNCTLQRDAYQCALSDGEDLARTALFNGGADVAADASADYHTQTQAAQAGHRGRWK
jgi:endonuclease YncB( thermonuclease family)